VHVRSVDQSISSAGAGPVARLEFDALYFPDRIHVVNPQGDVGVITLWSPFRTVKRKLDEVAPGIVDPARSRVAVVANLYGDGMFAMFCNLLYNPQVRHLVALGEDLGLPTCGEIEAFLERGLEETVMLGKRLMRVPGTERVFPAVEEFDVERLRQTLTFRRFGKLSDPRLGGQLTAYCDQLPAAPPGGVPERLRVDIPMTVPEDYSYRPSEVAAHQVVRRRPLDCWEELVVRCIRFGRPVMLGDGPRLELLNAKAVITHPERESEAALAKYGFQLERFLAYEQKMLRHELPEGISYTYGNRLGGYFEQDGAPADTIEAVIEEFRNHPETRRAYISIWDTASDLPGLHGRERVAVPCLTTLFFRRSENRVTLSATYRAHNLLTAWLENVYGLMAVQRRVSEAVGLEPGSITVLSHSLGVDPRSPRYEVGRAVADGWRRDDDVDRETGKFSLREDPNGYFIVTVDRERGCLVAEHRFGGVLIKRYEADRAIKIEREISADMAVSLVSHALWLGRELATKERLLRAG
jgi:hypothetical protein